MTVYIVAYDISSDVNRAAVEKYLEDFKGSKVKLQLSMYLIDAAASAESIRDFVAGKMNATTDRLWVSAYASPAAWRNPIDSSVLAWLNARGHV